MTRTFADEVSRKTARRFADLWETIPRLDDPNDTEAVHDVRVASRRLRAVMEAGAPCFPAPWFEPILALVKDVTSELGAVRDAEVMLAFLHTERDGADPAERPGLDRLVVRIEGGLAEHRAEMAVFLDELRRSPMLPEIERRFGKEARPSWLDSSPSQAEEA